MAGGCMIHTLSALGPPCEGQARDSRILVVDDELGIRDLLTMELSSLGYYIETASDGVQALEAIGLQDFQLVLCDIKMPYVGGLQVLESIRIKHPEVEVIMMTGYGTVETAVEALKCGAYDFIQKPFDLQELTALVAKCLEKSQLRATTELYEASRSVFRSIRIDELLPLIGDIAQGIFRVDDVSIMLVDSEGALNLALISGVADDAKQDVRLVLVKNIWNEKKLSNLPILVQDPQLKEGKTIMICPFSIDDVPLGVLTLARTRRVERFLTSDMNKAAIFTAQIAQAVFNAKLYRRLNANILDLQEANKKLEETKVQLIQSEKLAGIGEMAAGVAHELNNPLSAIIGFTQLVIGSDGLTEQQRKDLDTVYTQSKRCQVIIQNLLQFCRQTNLEMQETQVAPILHASLELIKHKLYLERIALTLKIPDALPSILCNTGQLQQVFLNLLMNAIHALEERHERRIIVEVLHVDQRLLIEFSDTGHGIPLEIRDKIFEPFFTSKPVGKGTGLGLSICYGIIKQHKGKLSVRSEINDGATFTVEFPISCEGQTGLPPKE
jgi:two-component system NtrC family sensor kinase